jgi:hypothetical protein
VGNDESVRCDVPYFPAAAVGLGAVFGGLVIEGVRELFSGRLSPALLVPFGLLVLTIGVSLIRSRYVTRTVEFSGTHVRLESPKRVRTVPIADVKRVSVEHGGDTASGYHETTLRLESRGGSEIFRCAHEPELVQALTRVLPERVAVTEEWPALQEPSTG